MKSLIIAYKIFILLTAATFTLSLSACSPTSSTNTTDQNHEAGKHEEGEHQAEEHHAEGEAHDRLPNDGAIIRIVSPADGATFKKGEEIVVEIATENFKLGEEDRHWELQLDGNAYASVEGGNGDEVLRGVEVGEHEISAYLALGTHQHLEEGASIHITVTE